MFKLGFRSNKYSVYAFLAGVAFLAAVLFIPGLLVFAGSGLLNVLITVCLADSIDYGEYKNGQRDESVICSMQTFVVKLASGVAVFFAGLAIKWVGLIQPADGTSDRAEHRNSLGTFHDDDSRSDSSSHHRTCILHQEIQADRGEDAGDHDET